MVEQLRKAAGRNFSAKDNIRIVMGSGALRRTVTFDSSITTSVNLENAVDVKPSSFVEPELTYTPTPEPATLLLP